MLQCVPNEIIDKPSIKVNQKNKNENVENHAYNRKKKVAKDRKELH